MPVKKLRRVEVVLAVGLQIRQDGGNSGYQLITGKLRRFFLDETRDATFYTENIFYKQVYLDD